MFDQRKRQRTAFGLESDPRLERFPEEYQRGQLARTDSQAFQIQELDAGDQRDDQRDGRGRQCQQQGHAVARSMSPEGRPNLLRQRASVRFMAPPSRLVIHSSQVQQAVQHQDAQFVLDAVAQFGGLRRGAVERNRNIVRGEGQHIRGVVLAAKLLVQLLQFRIRRNQTRHALLRQNLLRQIFQESSQISSVHTRGSMPKQKGRGV